MIDFLFNLFKYTIYQRYIESSAIFVHLFTTFEEFLSHEIVQYISEIFFQTLENILITIPVEIFSYIKQCLLIWRYLLNLRLTLTMFPQVNVYKFPLLLVLTETVDFFIRPLRYYIKKYITIRIPYLDPTYWLIFLLVQTIVEICNFLIKMSNSYNSI